jgi:hypothetical protein
MDDKAAIVLAMKVAFDLSAFRESPRPVLRLHGYWIDVMTGNGALFVK